MRFSQSTSLLMCLSLQTLTSIIRTDLSILVEVTYQVNSVIINPALLDLFISSDTSICSVKASPPLGNSDHVVVSVSIDFSSYSQGDASFHCIAYDYILVLIGTVLVIIWEMFHARISLSPVLLLLPVNFVSGFSLELMYKSLIESISSSLTHLHGFELFMLLP